jgi:hypothetical protein
VRTAQWAGDSGRGNRNASKLLAGTIRNPWNSPEYTIDLAIIDYLIPNQDEFEVLRLLRDMDSLQKEEKKINT